MKKWTAFLLCTLLVMNLTGCSKPAEGKAEWTEGQLQDLVDSGVFSEELEELDADMLWMLYHLEDAGLSRDQMESAQALRSAGATCEEAAVLRFVDGDSASLAAGALEGYVDGQIDANRNYRPGEIPKLENAKIDRRGCTLLLLVAGDPDAAGELLK